METEQEEFQEQEKSENNFKEANNNYLKQILKNTGQQEETKNIFINYRIINNHGVMTGDDAKIESISIHDTKEKKGKFSQKNIMSDEGEFSQWLIENYETYSMTIMIASAVFHGLPYTWVVQAADELYLAFKQEKEDRRYGITEILSRFGAAICQGEMNTYTGKTQIEVVRFLKKEYQEKILKYTWRECPQLHDIIVLWLKKYSMQKPVSMSKRALDTMGQIAQLDYYYFQHNMIGMIQQDRKISTDMSIACIVMSLSASKEYQDNVHKLVKFWSKENNVHYLLTTLFVCVESNDKGDILENAIYHYLCKSISGIQEHTENEWLTNIYEFFAAGMRSFTFYRILIEKIYEFADQQIIPSKKIYVCNLFLILFAVDLDLAQFEKGEDAIFIKLCTTKNEVCDKICYLWRMVWQCRYYRQTFYDLMADYERKQHQFPNSGNIERFVKKVFSTICTEEIQYDICCKIHRRVRNE